MKRRELNMQDEISWNDNTYSYFSHTVMMITKQTGMF